MQTLSLSLSLLISAADLLRAFWAGDLAKLGAELVLGLLVDKLALRLDLLWLGLGGPTSNIWGKRLFGRTLKVLGRLGDLMVFILRPILRIYLEKHSGIIIS